MKTKLFSLALMGAVMLNAQTYNNGPLSTGATTSTGTAAPAGYTWSELQSPNTTLGTAAFIGGTNNFRLADDFTIPATEQWNVTSVEVFGYQTGSTTFPIDQLNVRIWNGNPQSGGTIAFGSTSTNVLNTAASVDSKIYRTASTNVGTTRKIWVFAGNVATALSPGSYYLDYQVHAKNDGSVFFPPVTIAGQLGANNANALQYDGTQWNALVDGGSGAPQALPFVINYTITVLGTEESHQYDSRVAVYPNPVKDVFQLKLPEESRKASTQVSLFDQSGKLVRSFKFADTYNIGDLAKGMYLIKINDGSNVKVTKLLKQ